MILDETYNFIKSHDYQRFKNLTITDVSIGVYLTAVRLSDQSYGVAGRVDDIHPFCAKKDRDFGEFTPSKISGRKVLDLFEQSKDSGISNSLKFATLNAISSRIINESNYQILQNSDPIDLLDLTQEKTITIVGAFQSYIDKIAETKNKLYVLEFNEHAFADYQKQFYIQANRYCDVLPISDVVIITGLTLVNHTIDGLLSAISPKARVIVTGPSSSIVPDILFRHGVNIIGATRITNPEILFSIVSQGGTGFHLFKYCAEKITILNEKKN
jgi:uncharacterized protein (DUF4213/DUF364 family)